MNFYLTNRKNVKIILRKSEKYVSSVVLAVCFLAY